MDPHIKVTLVNLLLTALVPALVTGIITYIKGRLTPQQRARASALTEALGGADAITAVVLKAACQPADQRRDWAIGQLKALADSDTARNWSNAVAGQAVDWVVEKLKEKKQL